MDRQDVDLAAQQGGEVSARLGVGAPIPPGGGNGGFDEHKR